MTLAFGSWRLDPVAHRLEVDGDAVAVEPQVFALLYLLARNPGRLISRDELIDAVWNGRIVSESTITARIAAARRAIGDGSARDSQIETVPKCGIRLRAAATAPGASRASAPERQTVRFARSNDGTAVAFAQSGTGPPLLRGGHWLTHLEADWKSAWHRPLIDRLSAQFSLTRYDQRGTGLSQREIEEFSVDRLAEDLGAVADAAGLDRFAVFAASQAVPVTIRYMRRHPGRVSAAVFWGGFARGAALRAPDGEARSEAIVSLLREGWGRTDSAFMRAAGTLWVPGATPEQLASILAVQVASCDAGTMVRLRRAIDRIDVSADLAHVDAPVLVAHATGDAVHPIGEAQHLAAEIPGAQFRALQSQSHVMLPHLPEWTDLMDAATEFLRARVR